MNSELECQACGEMAMRVIVRSGFIGCDYCIPSPRFQSHGATVVRGGNHYNKKMTQADIEHIKTRRVREDGKIRPDARWDTKYK